MQHQWLEITRQLLSGLTAAIVAGMALTCIWLARFQPIEMDLAMLHYTAFLINEKGFLLYRDIFENNLPGPFLLHSLIGDAFGYGAEAVRWLDTALLLTLALLCWHLISPLSRTAAILAPALFTCLYFAGGTVAAFQRDYIAILPLTAALALLCKSSGKPVRDALLIGTLGGLACSLKPNFVVVMPALLWLLLQQAHTPWQQMFFRTSFALGLGFLFTFSAPFLWALRHADLAEFIDIYKIYTPLYISTRTDLYHYENPAQQWRDLLAMQADHLVRMSLFAIPGLLWAWRQQRDNPIARRHLFSIALLTFAIAWHEVIAGKYWFSHLLPPYFFTVICLSLLLVPVARDSGTAERFLGIALILVVLSCSFFAGKFSTSNLFNADYSKDNQDIRSRKIARYLEAHMQPGDLVQSLDGSGDGQGSLLLAKATSATRFIEDIPLYLQPDSPVTQGYRKEFLAALSEKPPAFFVYIHNFFHPAGGNRLQEFTELNAFIEKNYDAVQEEGGEYTIFRLKNRPTPDLY